MSDNNVNVIDIAKAKNNASGNGLIEETEELVEKIKRLFVENDENDKPKHD